MSGPKAVFHELALLRSEPRFERLSKHVREIASLLEEKGSIPMVREQMNLILEVQSDEWWQDVTVSMLERMRRRLRLLVQFIDKRQRKPVYTDFEDLIGEGTDIELPGFVVGTNQAKFIAKVRSFLNQHLDHTVITKLRRNEPLTSSDLDELERLFGESGTCDPDEIHHAADEAHGIGLFVRSLVGMDRDVAKKALDVFIRGKPYNSNQLEFINLIVNHLTEHGFIEPARLYESPFTDITPSGPEGLFPSQDIDELIQVLESVRATAVVA